jgi:hypothetical protein
MLPTATEFRKQHPEVVIEWEARSLYDFDEARAIAPHGLTILPIESPTVILPPHSPHSRAHGCALGPWDLCSFKRLRPRSLDAICLTGHLSARPWNRWMVYGPRCTKRKTSMTREPDLCVAI